MSGVLTSPPRSSGHSQPTQPGEFSLIDMLLRQQQETAVERFARAHEEHAVPLQAGHYRDFIPLNAPKEGEQYAFEVDLDSCSGCKACVTACHNLNGLDEDEVWRKVGLLTGGSSQAPVIQHVSTACHHCVEPACMEGCPVLAYEKDPITGIVRHLDDQCIGCQYCVLKCPYDVPRYSKKMGIVRKCDMCSSRLAVGEAPACVQACPNEAIRIAVVNKEAASAKAAANLFLPGTPEPGYTKPATTYKTQKKLPANLLPADYWSVAPQHGHLPLVFMLVLTQMSAGAFLVERVLTACFPRGLEGAGRSVHITRVVASLAIGLLGLNAAIFHLGRPLYAFRAFIGLRTSWLSREIVAFGGFAGLASAYAAAACAPLIGWTIPPQIEQLAGGAAALAGLVGVFCSVKIYADTRRPFWDVLISGPKFFATALCAGAAGGASYRPGGDVVLQYGRIAGDDGRLRPPALRVDLGHHCGETRVRGPDLPLAPPPPSDAAQTHGAAHVRRAAKGHHAEIRLRCPGRPLAAGGADYGKSCHDHRLSSGPDCHRCDPDCRLVAGRRVVGALPVFCRCRRPQDARIARLMNGTYSKLLSLLHQRTGPLTEQLDRVPGGFGLGQVPARQAPDAVTTMVCGFCSTGCGLKIHLQQGEAVNLSPDPNYPVNLGMACPKGWEALRVLKADDRATIPLLGNRGRGLRPVDWPTAMRTFCDRFKAIQAEHGPHSVAVLSTGQIATEEMALLGSLAKFGMGLRHVDSNTRQCMATAATAYKQSFGFDAPPYSYDDFEQSDVIVLVGANLCIAHPILWDRICRNPHRPQIVVIDPRKTETAMAATLHLAIQPKSDLVLFYGLAHILIREGWIDRDYIAAHTEGFEEFCWHVEQFTPDVVALRCGIEESALHWLAMLIHKGKRVSFWWTMGINQSYEGTRTAQSLINLALITGNMGRPGTGANSVTGQCNAMGSRLFANATSLLGGHDFEKPEDRRKIARILDIDAACIPEQNSWAYHEILEGILDGKIQGLWVIGTNPAHSWINQNMLGDVLARLDFLVVQDMYTTTETALRADLLLPAAAWGEKDGTFINSERRVGPDQEGGQGAGRGAGRFLHLPPGCRILGLRRDVPRLDRSGGSFPDPQGGLAGDTLRHYGHCRLSHARRMRRDPVALCGGHD